ncbi:hypothetical protein L1887_05047 [Cichorium endivia]|nr:hypothetical protein L1887_05047 [Cichorium endivia]
MMGMLNPDHTLNRSLCSQLASQIAIRMVIQDRLGPDDNPTVYHHDNVVTALSIRDNHEYWMAAKVEKMYYEKAKTILWSNENVLEMIVEELLEFQLLK